MLSAVPPPVTVRVPAKINLHLEVGGLRDDGFHDLVTVFHAVSLFDEVSVAVNPEPAIAVHGEGVTEVPADETNLAWRAVELLAEGADRDPDIALVLRKGIPVAGGMAGGSADAAAALVGLSALWKLDLSRDELAGLAAELGSDVTFALHGGTALGTGRGEQIVPVLSRHTLHWVIALHRAGLSTPAVFGELDRLRGGVLPSARSVEPVLEAIAGGDPRQLALSLANDLQPATVSLAPELRRTLRAGVDAGALAGLVSGSGPTCAFLCAGADAALDVATELAGLGVCRTVRVAHGPVPGARVVEPPKPGRWGRPVPGRRCAPDAQPRQPRDGHRARPRRCLAGATRPRIARGRFGRPHRRRRAQRRRQDHVARRPHRHTSTRRGRVSRVGGLRMARLAQGDDLLQVARARRRTRGIRGRARMGRRSPGPRRARRLGVHDLDRIVDGLSGGEKRRVALARALLGELDLVVLDEPTNHLDVEGIGWLAEHLVARRCAVVVVTHDRWFLDAVCTRDLGGGGRPGRGLPRRLRRLGVRPGRARAAIWYSQNGSATEKGKGKGNRGCDGEGAVKA